MVLSHGPDIDPASGQPAAYVEEQRQRDLNQKERERLEKQAAFSTVADSDAAQQLRDMVCGLLEGRINKVLNEDPEAMAYVKILRGLKDQTDLAKRAVNTLVQRGVLTL